MSSDPQLRLSMANQSNVPKEYVRALDPQLLPPRVGHNWNDQAFRFKQGKPQQLEAEFRGTRVFPATRNSTFPAPAPDMCRTAQQLVDALMSSSLNRNAATRKARAAADWRHVTLDDKVLRFYAFFSEPAPEAGAASFWHRRVVISFFPVDDTILIEEPRIINSGLDGGVFLKRQKVVADPRQREQFPGEEYVSLNFFNVGNSVRLNATDFFLYDCDDFTRDFLTALGIEVGAPVECPDDLFMSEYGRYQERLKSGKFGLLSQDSSADEVEHSVRFIRDGGKMLRFYAILDERDSVPAGMVRRLEVMLFVEDNSIAIVQRQSSPESCQGLYLSRCWLPKSGSVAKANELTFAHRVNGQREPDMGIPDAYYRDVDLDVGVTLNVFGRSVLLYDCDDYTREFFMERYGVSLRPPVDVSSYFQGDGRRTVLGTEAPTKSLLGDGVKSVVGKPATAADAGDADGGVAVSSANAAAAAKGTPTDTLRFRAVLARPANHDDEQRRFTVTYYTNSEEFMVYESAYPKAGINGGCMWKRRKVMKIPPKPGPRNAPKQPAVPGEVPHYTLSDLGEGKEVVINGLPLRLYRMDAHTATFYARCAGTLPEDTADGPAMVTDATGAMVTVDHLVSELRSYLHSRYGTGVASFMALDRDRDGIVSLPEFTMAMKAFQITEDRGAAAAIFAHIAPTRDTAYFTSVDLMKWIDAVGDEHRTAGSVRIASMPSGGREAELKEIERRALRSKVLRELKSRLDARCWKGADMFRLASTMPRAYRGRRADLYSFTNPDRDTVITPVQLRRCIEEILTGAPTAAEMACLLEFFFPTLPAEAYTQTRDNGTTYAVDLNEFQKRYYVMTKETMLPDDDAAAASSSSRRGTRE
ncbi:DUF1126 repeat-containing protein [Leishmania donovani]|uniref:EF-hand domain-containing family member C2 n=1 Tax=Leishmania donovani TaxID=5661 RepID=A0A6J8F4R0_LEIDO|nr:DUF1126 repeat-containing protein [Leishmania donovani]VDZ42377.1 Repeat_of_unknown_function_(DUF1126)_putative/Pfam:PF06565 [Leishmania donovani]